MNKKGYIRTIEAVLAVIIVLSVIAYVTHEQSIKKFNTPSLVKSSQNAVLNIISNDLALRLCVIEGHQGSESSGVNYKGLCNSDSGFTLKKSELPPGTPTSRIDQFIFKKDGVEIMNKVLRQ